MSEKKRSLSLEILADEAIADEIAENIAILKTLIEQDLNIIQRAKRYGIDPRDTFRCFGVEEGDRFVVHIATSGEKGIEYAKKFFDGFARTKRFVVENDPCKRYEFKDVKDYVEVLKEKIRERFKELEKEVHEIAERVKKLSER